MVHCRSVSQRRSSSVTTPVCSIAHPADVGTLRSHLGDRRSGALAEQLQHDEELVGPLTRSRQRTTQHTDGAIDGAIDVDVVIEGEQFVHRGLAGSVAGVRIDERPRQRRRARRLTTRGVDIAAGDDQGERDATHAGSSTENDNGANTSAPLFASIAPAIRSAGSTLPSSSSSLAASPTTSPRSPRRPRTAPASTCGTARARRCPCSSCRW